MQRFVIDIPDEKDSFFTELVQDLGYSIVEKITPGKPQQEEQVKAPAVEAETPPVLEKQEAQSVKDFLKEL